jgi:hypothetical protein
MALNLMETLLTGIASGALSGYAAYLVQERKLRRDYQLQDSAQRVTNMLLRKRPLRKTWRLRSFKVIRHHLGGFEDDALRQLLVRAGAIRFKAKSGEELWGLISRNRDRLGLTQIDEDPENLRDDALFLPDSNPKSREHMGKS